MDNIEETSAVIIDNGTGLIKAGISGEDAPGCCFPSCVGIPKYQGTLIGVKDDFIGEEAISKKGILNLSFPMEHGVVNNWEHMERIWNHTFFNELRVDPSERPVMLTEAPMNPKTNREKMTTIFFETFGVPAFNLQIQAILSLYSAGRCTGLVIDSGDGVTHTIPIYEGYAIQHAIKKINLAGRDITDYMHKILQEVGFSIPGGTGREIARQIKEKLGYVAMNPEEEQVKFQESANQDKPFELPDGGILVVKDQQYRSCELLFQPILQGNDFPGIHEIAFQSIQACDIDVRKDLFHNMILSGGTTMIQNLPQRLEQEVSKMAPKSVKVRAVAPPERQYSVWLGGSVLSSLASFQQNWITKQEYEESGVGIIHRKCF